MFPKEMVFVVEKRENNYTKSGFEYALNVSFDEINFWNIHCWDKKPTEKEIKTIKDAAIRSMEVYHRNLKVPMFTVVVKEDKNSLSKHNQKQE